MKRMKSPEERFWAATEKTDACWIWTAARLWQRGYGRIVINGRCLLAHRYSWTINHGPIPTGMFVCHRCDNPPCVNPDHLFLGTHIDNMADMKRKKRAWKPPGCGEQNSQAKLTANDVIDIRSLNTFGASQRALAIAFGVSRGAISGIIYRTNWGHI